MSKPLSRLAVVVVLVLLAAVGCAGSGEPDDYNEVIETNFMDACVEANERGDGDPGIDDPESYCECVYAEFEENVPYEEFKAEDDQLREDVPDGIITELSDLSTTAEEIISRCIAANAA